MTTEVSEQQAGEHIIARIARFAFIFMALLAIGILLRSSLNADVYLYDIWSFSIAFGVPIAGAILAFGLALSPVQIRANAFLLGISCVTYLGYGSLF